MKTGRCGLPDWHSETTFRSYCAFGFKGVILMGKSRFALHQRLARRRGANSGYCMPNQRRAYQELNVVGVRIWVNKPRQFGGNKRMARRATVAAYCKRSAEINQVIAALAAEQMRQNSYNGPADWFDTVLFAESRRKYIQKADRMCMADAVSLDAPHLMPAGGCIDLTPFWCRDDDTPQMLVARGGL